MPLTGFGDIAERLRRSTVLVHARSRGSGSGVIWSSDGTIVTNAHVTQGAQAGVQLWDGRECDATVVSRDRRRDLAALRIDAANLPLAFLADSSRTRPGQLVIAIGNPLGFVGALTTGIVHAVGPLRGLGPQPWIQATVRLAPGNSGGPLADAEGRVIGINTMVAGGLGLAIPSDVVRDFLATGPTDVWLGVTVQPVRIPRSGIRRHDQQTFGILLTAVESRGPAAAASLLPGDIVLGTEQAPFTSIDDLARELSGRGPRLLRLEFLRGDYSRVRRVTLQVGGGPAAGSDAAA